MKTEEKIVDKVLDTLIDEASAEAYRKEADYNAPEVAFSPEHERNMQKLFKNERRKYNLRRATVVTGKVACFVVAIAIVMGIAISSVEAWRTKFLNFFYDKDAPNTVVRFSETKHNSYSNDMVDIGYIPNGFEIEKDKTGIDNLFLKFVNEEKFIQIKRNNDSLKTAINTERGTLETIKVNSYEGVYMVNNNANVLLWHDGVYTFRLSSNLEKEELLKIAKLTYSK